MRAYEYAMISIQLTFRWFYIINKFCQTMCVLLCVYYIVKKLTLNYIEIKRKYYFRFISVSLTDIITAA